MIKITISGEATDDSMIVASAIKRFLSNNDAKYTFNTHEFSEKMFDDHFHGHTYEDLKAGLWNKEIEFEWIQKPRIGKIDKNLPKCKKIKDFDSFYEFWDEVKTSCKNIYINGKKADKRKSINDFEDVFDNNVTVQYYYSNKDLNIIVGNWSPEK